MSNFAYISAFAALLLHLVSLTVAPAAVAASYGPKKTIIADPVKRQAKAPVAREITDPTTPVVFAPGLEVTFHIFDGLDTQWKLVGNYDFMARIEESGREGYIYEWQMSNPADASGSRRVEPGDIHHSRKVSLFYPKHETTTLVGYNNALRISDDLFRDLKLGKRLSFHWMDLKVSWSSIKRLCPCLITLQAVGKRQLVCAWKAKMCRCAVLRLFAITAGPIGF
jgi:hypothetical protein